MLSRFKRAAKVHREVGEALSMLDSIASDLVAGCGPQGEPLDHREQAMQLEFSPEALDRLGYADLAKELKHVRETLESFAGSEPAVDETTETEALRQRERQAARDRQRPATFATSTARAASAGQAGWQGVMTRILGPPGNVRQGRIAVIAVAGAAVVAVLILTLAGGPRRTRSDPPAVVVDPPPAPTVAVAPVTPRQVRPTPTVDPRLREVPELVSQARLALHEGDTTVAGVHLSAAALIDRDHPLVLETARVVVDALVEAADRAVAEERWEDAEDVLEQARAMALRFFVDTAAIERRIRELYRTEWVFRLGAEELDELGSLVGADVVVALRDGRTLEGVVREVDALSLTLEGRSGVGGGQVQFTTSVDIDAIDDVRYSIRPTQRLLAEP